jgi:hypothetical protein
MAEHWVGARRPIEQQREGTIDLRGEGGIWQVLASAMEDGERRGGGGLSGLR